MKDKFTSTWFNAAHKKDKKSLSTGFMGMKTEIVEEYRAREIDMDGFAQMLADIYTQLDNDGYDVVNVLPINMAVSEEVHGRLKQGGTAFLGEVGFSLTKGAVVVGKLRESKGER